MKRCCLAVLLLLLLCRLSEALDEAQTGSLVQQPDHDLLWAELRHLRATVVEQQVQLSASEEEAKDLRDKVLHLGARLEATEVYVEGHQTRLEATEVYVEDHQSRLEATETRLEATEVQVEDLEKQSEVHAAQLSTVQTNLTATDNQVQDLRNPPKVAFSVGLGSGSVGPYRDHTTLIYQKVFINLGNGYNESTGIFTPGVKGVYQFRFTAAGVTFLEHVGIKMYINGHQVMYTDGYNNGGYVEYVSNGLILQLDPADRVYMVIPSGGELYDSYDNHNVFSGFLLYAM